MFIEPRIQSCLNNENTITAIPLILLFVVSTVFRGYSSSCSWDPSNTDTIEVGASVTIQAQPGDPAPNNQGHCACDSQNTSVDWAPTGNWRVSYGGAADSGGTLDTSPSGDERGHERGQQLS